MHAAVLRDGQRAWFAADWLHSLNAALTSAMLNAGPPQR